VGERKKENIPANDAFMSQKILIIGASSGLGRELALLYAQNGCRVAVMARREGLLKELHQQFPATIIVKRADIADENISQHIAEAIHELNGLDTIILAASIIQFNHDLSAEPENETVSINVSGFTRIITAAWKYFSEKGGGHIVGITSIAAARGNKIAPAYHASKSFQSIYLESLRVKAKHAKNNIAVTELVPGYMHTAMGKGDRMFWVITVEKAARRAIRAIDKKRKRVFIPKRWWWVYHIQRLLPIFIYDWIVNGNWKLKKKTRNNVS
jgi:short-subunit dehydrogenase